MYCSASFGCTSAERLQFYATISLQYLKRSIFLPMVHSSVWASEFVGRQDELAHIDALLSTPACRLLTLVGPGGIGKTRLALEAARQLPNPEHAHFVPLQPLTSPDFIVSAIADALGLQFYGGTPPKQQLLDYLRDKSWLLVLDNFEHLLDGAELPSELLASAPSLRLLVTSRERLKLVEEWVLDVSGLDYPARGDEGKPERYSAVELFTQQAQRVKVGFTITDHNRPSVVRICSLVGGMPLAIELSATWVRALSCQSIAEEIGRSLDILETPERNIEPRHRTMRAAFEPTWARLSDHERDVFMRLSVFRGGFTREAAQKVAGASLRTLSALVDKSLLRVDANGRYDVHELLRQYSEEKLLDADQDAETQHRHCQFFLGLAEQLERRLFGPQQVLTLDQLESEHDNFRAALKWTLQSESVEWGLRLASALGWFWHRRTYWQEGLQRLEVLLEAGHDATAPVRGKALHHVMQFHWHLMNDLYFEVLSTQALSLARELVDMGVKAWLLLNVATLDRSHQNLRQAYSEEALRLFRALDDQWGICETLLRLGMTLSDSGDFAGADDVWNEGIRLARQAGDKSVLAYTLCASAHAQTYTDKMSQRSENYFRESLELFRELRYKDGMSWSLVGLGLIARAHGTDEYAKAFFAQSLKLVRETHNPWWATYSLINLAAMVYAAGELERGTQLYGAVSNLVKMLFVSSDSILDKADLESYERSLAAARVQLGDGAFAAAFAEGQRMTLDEAITDALGERAVRGEALLSERVDQAEMVQRSQAVAHSLVVPLT